MYGQLWLLNENNPGNQLLSQSSRPLSAEPGLTLLYWLHLCVCLWSVRAVGMGQTTFPEGNSSALLPAAKMGRPDWITQLTLAAAFQLGVGPKAFVCLSRLHSLFVQRWVASPQTASNTSFCGMFRMGLPPVGSSHNLWFGGSHANPEHGWFTLHYIFKPWCICASNQHQWPC